MNENARLQKRCNHLELTLRIPRHHLKYLEEHGTLDEFVKAKHDNDNLAARQVLDRAAEADGITKKNT